MIFCILKLVLGCGDFANQHTIHSGGVSRGYLFNFLMIFVLLFAQLKRLTGIPYAGFLPWDLPERQAMVLWQPCWKVTDHLTEQTRTNMSANSATRVE